MKNETEYLNSDVIIKTYIDEISIYAKDSNFWYKYILSICHDKIMRPLLPKREEISSNLFFVYNVLLKNEKIAEKKDFLTEVIDIFKNSPSEGDLKITSELIDFFYGIKDEHISESFISLVLDEKGQFMPLTYYSKNLYEDLIETSLYYDKGLRLLDNIRDDLFKNKTPNHTFFYLYYVLNFSDIIKDVENYLDIITNEIENLEIRLALKNISIVFINNEEFDKVFCLLQNITFHYIDFGYSINLLLKEIKPTIENYNRKYKQHTSKENIERLQRIEIIFDNLDGTSIPNVENDYELRHILINQFLFNLRANSNSQTSTDIYYEFLNTVLVKPSIYSDENIVNFHQIIVQIRIYFEDRYESILSQRDKFLPLFINISEKLGDFLSSKPYYIVTKYDNIDDSCVLITGMIGSIKENVKPELIHSINRREEMYQFIIFSTSKQY